MVAWHKTFRDMESDLSGIKFPWWNGEPVLDNTTVCRCLAMVPYGWLVEMLTRTARLCMTEAGEVTGLVGTDSSGRRLPSTNCRTAPQKTERFCRDGPKGVPKVPHSRRPRTADHTRVRDHPEQHRRCDHAATHAGRDETAAFVVRPSFMRAGGTTQTTTARYYSRWGLHLTSNREAVLSTATSLTETGQPRYSMMRSATNAAL